jgi:YgiT-type zinc finger domain-containing protein
MRCAVCKNGETKQNQSVITLTKEKLVIVFRNVPSEICHDCSEEYINEETTDILLQTAKESLKKGVVLDSQDWDKISADRIT